MICQSRSVSGQAGQAGRYPGMCQGSIIECVLQQYRPCHRTYHTTCASSSSCATTTRPGDWRVCHLHNHILPDQISETSIVHRKCTVPLLLVRPHAASVPALGILASVFAVVHSPAALTFLGGRQRGQSSTHTSRRGPLSITS